MISSSWSNFLLKLWIQHKVWSKFVNDTGTYYGTCDVAVHTVQANYSEDYNKNTSSKSIIFHVWSKFVVEACELSQRIETGTTARDRRQLCRRLHIYRVTNMWRQCFVPNLMLLPTASVDPLCHTDMWTSMLHKSFRATINSWDKWTRVIIEWVASR